MVNGYLGGNKNKRSKMSYFEKQILSSRDANQSLYKYLKGSGKKKIPYIVGKHLGPHWYTGPAMMLSRLPIVNDIVVEKILENTLPKINGSTNLARQFLAAGGNL